jgi:succinoglycan biosynthesis protein ExoM
MSTEISICIATHRRPHLLQRLLTSILEQVDAPVHEVIVVDNDVQRSAEPVAEQFCLQFTLSYLVEPIRGLARVRNRAVAASQAKYLAFIDDDHCATRRWLAAHYQTAIQTQAAVVIGSTDYVFDDEVPDFIRNCKFFINRPCTDGETLPWFRATTANCLIRRDALPSSAPFSSEFDLTGGEDVDLFFRMAEAGALIVACDHAYTVSYHPPSRANLYWCIRRAFRAGGTGFEVAHRRDDWWQKLRIGAVAGVQGVKSGIGAIWVWPRNKAVGMRRLLGATGQFGIVARLCGIRIQEYRHHH